MKKKLCSYLVIFMLLINAYVLAIGDEMAPADNIKVTTNSVNVPFPDQQPIILNGRTYIPVRFIAENLGADVEWYEETHSVLITREEVNLKLSIDSKNLTKTGYGAGQEEIITMDAPPLIINDRTMLPIRFVAEALGCSVDWDSETKTVVIIDRATVLKAIAVNTKGAVSGVSTFDYAIKENPAAQPVTTPSPSEEATPSPSPTEPPEIVIDASKYEHEVLRLVNAERDKKGLSPLLWDETLALAARKHSIDMAIRKFFSHQNTIGLGPSDRMRDEGADYDYLGENIAEGIRTPEEVVEAWMNSPLYNDILSKQYTHLGVGFYYMDNSTNGYYYWTQCFGGDDKRGLKWGTRG